VGAQILTELGDPLGSNGVRRREVRLLPSLSLGSAHGGKARARLIKAVIGRELGGRLTM